MDEFPPTRTPRVPPEPEEVTPIAPEYRLPLRGKMVAPTASPATAGRLANIIKMERARRRRGFLIGLLVGQFLILGSSSGGSSSCASWPTGSASTRRSISARSSSSA